MGLNMSGVYVRELMCEMYCGVMAWLTRLGDLRDITFQLEVLELWSAPIGHGATQKELIMWVASERPIR